MRRLISVLSITRNGTTKAYSYGKTMFLIYAAITKKYWDKALEINW